MKYTYTPFFIPLVLGALFVTAPIPTHASTPFDPDIILQDSELQNTRGMSKNDIQAFLVSQRSPLAKLRTPNTEGKDKRASDIIHYTAKKYNINPKYLLVTLEKEQSLVTKKTLEQRRLDWATGYAVCDDCSKDDLGIQKHKGFANQIDGAAGIMRWYYDNLKTTPWIKRAHQTYTIDKTAVTPQTHATAFLYNYTPHIQGNQNFWRIWQKWFGQVYPDGTLIRRKNNATVYIVKDGKKHAFASTAARISRHGQAPVITVPYSEFIRYTKGPDITLPNYSLVHDGTTYFLIDDDVLRPFDGYSVIRNLGYHPDEIITVTQKEISHLARGQRITADTKHVQGRVVRLKKKPLYYYLKNGHSHKILDKDIIAINFPNLSIETVPKNILDNTTPGSPVLLKNGTLVKSKRHPSIYIIEHGKKRHIPNKEVFVMLGYKEEHVLTLNTRALHIHKTGDPLIVRKKSTKRTNIAQKKKPNPTSSPKKQHNTGPKVTITEGKMFTVSKAHTNAQGPAFATPLDTYLVMDPETGASYMEKNTRTPRPLASLTKVISAKQLFDEKINLGGSVAYNERTHKALYHYFRIHPGEVVKNIDLLDAAMVSSLNTATKMLVTSVDSEKNIISNIQKSLGDTKKYPNTFIDSVTGESPYSVSSAKEYAQLFLSALKHPELRKSLGKKIYNYTELVDKDRRPNHHDTHTNALARKQHLPYTVLASKTGYLHESGANLAMLIERKSDKKQFLIVTMGNPQTAQPHNAPDKLTRYAISHF